jgi:hypothetical protein
MIVTRIGPMSLARISGVIYAIIGFLVGCAISVASAVGGAPEGVEGAGLMVFGAAAVFLLPIFYGFLGFVMSLVVAGVYNALARIIGGIELDIREAPDATRPEAWPPPLDR